MATLYLHCAVCHRKQANGLLSGAAWARVQVAPGTAADHPGIHSAELRVCPNCTGHNPDWNADLLKSLGLGGDDQGLRFAGSQ